MVKGYQKFVCDVFYEIAKNHADQLAMVFDRQLSYTELNKKTNQLANFIISKNFKPEDRVALVMEKSIDFFVSLLAVIKSGCAFVLVEMPKAEESSQERFFRCLEGAVLKDYQFCIVSYKRHQKLLTRYEDKTIFFIDDDSIKLLIDEQSSENVLVSSVALSFETLAYITFTSGSSGFPKGVMIEHDALCARFQSHQELLQLTPEDKIAQFAPIHIDACIMEVLMAWMSGACLVVVPSHLSSRELKEYYTTQGITVSIFAPSVLEDFTPDDFSSIRAVLTTGEAVGVDLLRRWSVGDRIAINGYGPSEVTIGATLWKYDGGGEVSIGTAMLGSTVKIVAISPKQGEIYISGAGIARGYCNDEEQTKKRFFTLEDGTRVYKTGDAGYIKDGKLYITGRLDRQIKKYGRLISPEEVESKIKEFRWQDRAIIQHVLFDREKTTGLLIARIKLDRRQELPSYGELLLALSNFIAKWLDRFMYPQRWWIDTDETLVEHWKLQIKDILWKNLYIVHYETSTKADDGQVPAERYAIVETLKEVWRDLLCTQQESEQGVLFKIYEEDNFYYVGGDSLNYKKLISYFCEKFKGVVFPVDGFMSQPTLKYLADVVWMSRCQRRDLIPLNDIPLSATGWAVYFVHPLLGDTTGIYSAIAASLERPAFGVNARILQDPYIPADLKLIAKDYRLDIEAKQKKPPYVVLGWSAGGMILYEMVRQWQAEGKAVASIIFDGVSSRYMTTSLDVKAHAIYIVELIKETYKVLYTDIGDDRVKDLKEDVQRCVYKVNSRREQIQVGFNCLRRFISTNSHKDIAGLPGILRTAEIIVTAILLYEGSCQILDNQLLVVARDQFAIVDETLGWQIEPDNMRDQLITIPGNHLDIVSGRQQSVPMLEILKKYLPKLNIQLQKPPLVKSPNKYRTRLCNVPENNLNFTGRKRELVLLESKFSKYSKCAITQKEAIVGLGGIGKTQLAKAFIYQSINTENLGVYAIIGWLDAEKGLHLSYLDLAVKLLRVTYTQLNQLQFRDLKSQVDSELDTVDSWLLVFDNVECLRDIKEFLPPPSNQSKGHILITSRNQFWDVNYGYKLELHELNRIDAISLLFKNINNLSELNAELIAILNKLNGNDGDFSCANTWPQTQEFYYENLYQYCMLAETLGDYPLALIQASAAIRLLYNGSILEYLEAYNNKFKKIQHEEEALVREGQLESLSDGYNRTVQTTLELIINKFENSEPGKITAELLRSMTFLDPTQISNAVFRAILSLLNFEKRNEAIYHSKIILKLLEHSLIHKVSDDKYNIHRVVQNICYYKLSPFDAYRLFKIVLKSIESLFKESLFQKQELINNNKLLLPHVEVLVERAQQVHVYEQMTLDAELRLIYAKLVLKVAEYYTYERRDKNQAAIWLKWALDSLQKCDENVEENKVLFVCIYIYYSYYYNYLIKDNNVIVTARDVGLDKFYLDKAEHVFVSIREQGENYYYIYAQLLQQKANVYFSDSSCDEAYKYCQEALDIKLTKYSATPADIGYTYHGLGRINYGMQQFEEALYCYQLSIDNKVKHYGTDNHIDVVRTFSRLGNVLCDLNRYNDAIAIFENAQAFYRKYLIDIDHYEVKKVDQDLIIAKSGGKKMVVDNKEGATHQMSIAKIPRPLIHIASIILADYINPRYLGELKDRYYDSLNDMPLSIKTFIELNQLPNPDFRQDLKSRFNDRFVCIAEQLERDNVLILPGYLSGEQLTRVREYYDRQLQTFGNENDFLDQASFSGSSHSGVRLEKSISEFLVDPFLTCLLSNYAGGKIMLSDFRGYTTRARKDILFRAWKWHHDGGREPERKLMILLNDVYPGGQEMYYLKGSERYWKGSRQKDANFTMKQVLDLSGRSSITRCFGPAGTVIIFTGQGLHRATRGHADRSVLVFTYKRNIPGAAIYPISTVDKSVRSSVKNTFIGEIFNLNDANLLEKDHFETIDSSAVDKKANEVVVVGKEQDTTVEETQNLLEQYNDTSTLCDSKSRFQRGLDNLDEFIFRISKIDIHHDIDLWVHDDNSDVPRDVLRIAIREYHPSAAPMARLKARCQNLPIDIHYLKRIDELRKYAYKLQDLKIDFEYAQTIIRLANDLGEAFTHCDSVQDLRTNMLFLYFCYDLILENLQEINDSFYSQAKEICICILYSYVQVVVLDDAYFYSKRQPDNLVGLSIDSRYLLASLRKNKVSVSCRANFFQYVPQHLVIVACNGIYRGNNYDIEEICKVGNWLTNYSNQGYFYFKHIIEALKLIKLNLNTILVLSGGMTDSRAGKKSEAQSYLDIIKNYFAWDNIDYHLDMCKLNLNRIILEEYARDSFENIFFGLCRYYEQFHRYPSEVTIISFAHKEERLRFHFETIKGISSEKLKNIKFNFKGVDLQLEDNHPIYQQERQILSKYLDDPLGNSEELSIKRESRNPFSRVIPYTDPVFKSHALQYNHFQKISLTA